jgi:hypothetical protein
MSRTARMASILDFLNPASPSPETRRTVGKRRLAAAAALPQNGSDIAGAQEPNRGFETAAPGTPARHRDRNVHGILKVTLPKTERARIKAKRIAINAPTKH